MNELTIPPPPSLQDTRLIPLVASWNEQVAELENDSTTEVETRPSTWMSSGVEPVFKGLASQASWEEEEAGLMMMAAIKRSRICRRNEKSNKHGDRGSTRFLMNFRLFSDSMSLNSHLDLVRYATCWERGIGPAILLAYLLGLSICLNSFCQAFFSTDQGIVCW